MLNMLKASDGEKKDWLICLIELAMQLTQGISESFIRHKLVRLLPPKQPHKQLLLRHSDVRIIDLADEVDAIQQQLRKQFSSTPSTLQVMSEPLRQLPFHCRDVAHALRGLSTYKAVPPGYVPTELWKRYAKPIGEKLWQLLSQSWLDSAVAIPSCWSASWLCLMPKLQKSQQNMSGWRPISLQDPCGKAILSIITRLATNQCAHILRKQPQFACLSGRSTSDAIRRVTTLM